MKVVFRRVLPPPLCPRDRPFNQSFEHFSKAAPQIRMVIRHSYLRSQIHLRDILNLNVVRRRSQLDIVVLLQFHVHLRQMRLCKIRKLFHFTPNHTREEAHPSHPHPLKSIGTSSCRPYSPHLAKDEAHMIIIFLFATVTVHYSLERNPSSWNIFIRGQSTFLQSLS